MKHKAAACCCITFMRSDSTEEPSGHKLTQTVAAFVGGFSECDAMSFVNSFFFFPAQNKTNQIVPEFTVDLRGATIGWASKDKSSKKNVLEVCCLLFTGSKCVIHAMIFPPKNKSDGLYLIISSPVKKQERCGVPDTVRHRKHHHWLAQSLNGHHTTTGESSHWP